MAHSETNVIDYFNYVRELDSITDLRSSQLLCTCHAGFPNSAGSPISIELREYDVFLPESADEGAVVLGKEGESFLTSY